MFFNLEFLSKCFYCKKVSKVPPSLSKYQFLRYNHQILLANLERSFLQGMYYEMFTYFYSCINCYKKFVLENYTYLLSKYLRPKTYYFLAVRQYNGNTDQSIKGLSYRRLQNKLQDYETICSSAQPKNMKIFETQFFLLSNYFSRDLRTTQIL